MKLPNLTQRFRSSLHPFSPHPAPPHHCPGWAENSDSPGLVDTWPTSGSLQRQQDLRGMELLYCCQLVRKTADSLPSKTGRLSQCPLPPWLAYSFFFSFLFFFNKSIYLFICLWLRWVFAAAPGLSLVAASRGYSSLRCAGFSLRWLLLSRSTGSRLMGFSSCGTQAQ